jgi:hypothetical protein
LFGEDRHTGLVAVVVIIVMIIVMVVVVFMIPVACMVLPSLVVVVVVRMVPIGPGIGRSLPSAGHPHVAVALNAPISSYPYIALSGVGWHSLIADRRRSRAYVDADLPRRWDRKRKCRSCNEIA